MYEAAVVSPLRIPRSGKAISGTNDVAARGIAAVIHHTAINTATAAIFVTFGFAESKSVKIKIRMKIKSPVTNPIF